MDSIAVQEQELVKLVNHLEEAPTAYGMQIRARMHHKVVGNFGSEADIRSLHYSRFRFNETSDVRTLYSRWTGEVNSNRVTSSLLRK